jgi:Carboxypeptidase regulatory-like domain
MRFRVSTWAVAALVVLATLALQPAVSAQDFRGSILGSVTDTQGGAMPGVAVTVTNLNTNVSSTVVTDDKGRYRVQYLISGTYSVQMQLQGFKSVMRKPLEVRVGDVLTVDATMDTGTVEEVIEVVAQQPLLDTSSGITGQVIDSNQIQQLPLGDGTAYMLTRLAPGLSDSSDLHFSRPMDNGNLAGIVANGAMGGNDFTLDGAPNRVSPNTTQPGNNFGVVGFSPPSDAIAEFKVQTNAFDAQSGQTAGASVNLALKSGTNAFHGNFSYFNRDDSRSETPLLTERADGEKPTRDYNRHTATFTGPILRDKTFFMVSYEHLRDVQPEPSTFTVPTMRMRSGDLSEFSSIIYDPLTATGPNNQRTPFPGNRVPSNRIDPVAAAYAALYPEPTDPTKLEDNYFTNMLRPYDYNAVLGRIDHNFSGSNKLFVSGYWNKRQEDRYNWAKGAANATGEGVINGFEVTKGFDNRSNTGVTMGFTSTRSSNLVFDVRGAWTQFGENRDPSQTFDPASLGFAQSALGVMGDYDYLPFITFGGFSTTNANSRIASLGSQRSDWNAGFDRPFTNFSIAPTVTWLQGSHSLRAGYDLRMRRWDITNDGYGAGRYHFAGTYTRANNSAPQNDLAQEWAQFLLGIPTAGTNTVATPGSTGSQFEIAALAEFRQTSHGLFLQDDWRVNRSLTLNLGVRLEVERGLTEAEDRNLGGFDAAADSPIEPAARLRYASNPIPQIPASEFQVNGGVLFADGPVYNTLVKALPRASFSYLLGDKTVLRGGVGLFSFPYYFDAGNQAGFSQPTPILTTDNNGATFLGPTLSNPLPGGQLVQPVGSALGLASQLGLTLGTIVPSERKTPFYTRWQAGIQRDLGAGIVVELFYVGSRGRNLPVVRELNGIPLEFLSTSRMRDTANETFLSQQVPNPFQGLLPGTTMNGATIQRGQLLRLFPQFLGGANNGAVSGTGTISVGTEEYAGSDSYDAGTIRVEKRFSNGNSLLATYTRSRARDQLNYLNPTEPVLEDRISPNDRPNRVTVGATFHLPFGKGRKWGSDWGGVAEAFLGGWSLSGTYQYQTGFPYTWNSNVYYDPARNPLDLKSNIGEGVPCGIAGLDCPGWDTSGFYIPGGTGVTDPRIQMGQNVRYFPSTLPDVRTHDLHLMDIGLYKTFSLPKDLDLQIRVEAINALNYTVLWNANLDPRNASFGLVNQDRNNPRDIQLGARLSF